MSSWFWGFHCFVHTLVFNKHSNKCFFFFFKDTLYVCLTGRITEKRTKREREVFRQLFHSPNDTYTHKENNLFHWPNSQLCITVLSWNQKLNPGHLCEWQGLNYLSYHLLPSTVYNSRKLELGMDPVPRDSDRRCGLPLCSSLLG